RYSVLMPNTARGGGISRKITNAQDRSRLKAIAEELDVPEGMGVILRTAGASRTKAEVKRDFEYLLRMWETVRETTLASSAPTLVYEEGSLIKRAIRDLYSKEVEEIVVAGEAGYREARQFMRLLMPSHVNSVQLYRDTQPVFAKAGVESQLDAMFSNQVTLKSGGYIVINQTEALVAIDVNSGRSTREHNIEDTALRTNLEAADEIARQLRLRDLAGLIVVDFIDMEESRNNRAVERRIKDALKNDRARIQVGRISHFGLLEMSRQRIRTGVLEGSTVVCPHCQGAGVVRSTASIALHVLRVLEDGLIKSSTHDVTVRTRTPVALYILNQKRANLRDLERRFGVAIAVEADDTLTGANYHAIERGELATGVKSEGEPAKSSADDITPMIEEPAPVEAEDEDTLEAPGEENEEAARVSDRGGSPSLEEGEAGRRRRRRRRRRGGERSFGDNPPQDAPQPTDDG
ncbi:MAG: Rne/Rng family ribonuclease, partial [Roseiarcus sp.]